MRRLTPVFLCRACELWRGWQWWGRAGRTGLAGQGWQDREGGSPGAMGSSWGQSPVLFFSLEILSTILSVDPLKNSFFFLCEWRAAGWKYCFMLLINCSVSPLLGLSSAMNSALSKTAPYWEVSAPFYPGNSKAGVFSYTLKFNFPSVWYLGSSLPSF